MIYPKSNAYRSETGGVMSALRALTVEQSALAAHKVWRLIMLDC